MHSKLGNLLDLPPEQALQLADHHTVQSIRVTILHSTRCFDLSDQRAGSRAPILQAVDAMPAPKESCREVALSFARNLAERAYESAYELTAREYRAANSVEVMRDAFELIVPLDWGNADPIETVQTMDTWPGKRASDLMWVYVSIGGDVYSEGLAAILTAEDDQPRIREVEFGRP